MTKGGGAGDPHPSPATSCTEIYNYYVYYTVHVYQEMKDCKIANSVGMHNFLHTTFNMH